MGNRCWCYNSFLEALREGNYKIKILHVWDTAGVGATLAKYQRQLGHQVTVVKLGNWDGTGIDEYYKVKATFTPQKSGAYQLAKRNLPKNHTLRVLLYKLWKSYPTLKLYFYVVRNMKNYDVLHIHGVWSVVFFIGKKPKILEFHGDDVRDSPSKHNWLKRGAIKMFVNSYSKKNKVYVSTPDLLSEVSNGVWIPNIADIEHFKNCSQREIGTALYSKMWYESGSHAEKFAKAHNLKLTVLDRKNQVWIDFRDFPAYLGKFEYYIDRKEIKSLSKTALEALAVGCKVVDYEGNVREGLPAQHYPLTVAKFTIQIYEQQLGENKK